MICPADTSCLSGDCQSEAGRARGEIVLDLPGRDVVSQRSKRLRSPDERGFSSAQEVPWSVSDPFLAVSPGRPSLGRLSDGIPISPRISSSQNGFLGGWSTDMRPIRSRERRPLNRSRCWLVVEGEDLSTPLRSDFIFLITFRSRLPNSRRTWRGMRQTARVDQANARRHRTFAWGKGHARATHLRCGVRRLRLSDPIGYGD